ncbi:MAG: hypothetical protein GY847_00495, partial [Proteobacteria bacterium]|nr:hypothetical protein [Pseudomonadota bacterium]
MDKNYIFTSYFTTKKCPQRRKHRFGKNVYSLINTWYKSLNLLGIEGIIFYDDLSSDFISKYQNATIRFIQYDLGVRSTNDERFICYREYLLSSSHIDNCFFTDLFDVTFFKNPFLLISDDYDIYVGSENKYNVKWMRRAYMNAYGKTFYPDKKMLNAGILGGKIDNIL